MKSVDVVAIGSCYIDINTTDYPFSQSGIPVETELVGGSYDVVPGGSAVNFCLLLQSFGLQTSFIGMVGDDQNSDLLRGLLEKAGVRLALICRKGLLTNISFNMTNGEGKHIMLVAGTANAALQPDVVVPKLEQAMTGARMLYLGGCFKLKSLQPAFLSMAELANKHNTMLVVDHGRIPHSIPAETLDIVKQLALKSSYYLPSREEFCRLWDVENIEKGLELLYQRAPKLTVIVKDGANGAYYWQNGLQHVAGTEVDRIVNLTGAGDSFNAGVMAVLGAGRSVQVAAEYGCAVAAAKIAGKPLPKMSQGRW